MSALMNRGILNRRAFIGGFVALGALGSSAAAWAKTKVPVVIFQLPKGHSKDLAWTIDDGASSSAIAAYIELARRHDLRLTFFVTSAFSGWRKNAKVLKPLVESGQIQLANHTKTHVDLTKVSDQRVKDELLECERFIMKVYGVDPKPYFRPPYGFYNDRVLRIAANLGYTKPIMWFGTLADTGRVSPSRILKHAKEWMKGGRIVIDHANANNTVDDFAEIVTLIRERELNTVTLREVLGD